MLHILYIALIVSLNNCCIFSELWLKKNLYTALTIIIIMCLLLIIYLIQIAFIICFRDYYYDRWISRTLQYTGTICIIILIYVNSMYQVLGLKMIWSNTWQLTHKLCLLFSLYWNLCIFSARPFFPAVAWVFVKRDSALQESCAFSRRQIVFISVRLWSLQFQYVPA